MDTTPDRSIAIPVEALATVPAGCTMCAWHGAPAVRRAGFALQSRPALRTPRVGVLSTGIDRLAEHAERVKIAKIVDWPLCRRCVRTRRGWLSLAAVLFWGGLAAMAAAVVARIVLGEVTPVLGVPLLGGFVMALSSPAAFVASSLPRITRARTSTDGRFVQVTGADPRFVAEVRTLLGGS
ncbi:hypothetical protein [Actinomadura sp. HBU206391]|uniref:hypothetical protein n=1 Tax=Actinomadura sp. HBU206391 TaxID=2731692 RepID=UPI00164FEB93|nr:hypothetical protein [Actinomadura sp. HBU206391]MBC6460401.1 hypothetical protein [Actinomadura sp. HBU206391]